MKSVVWLLPLLLTVSAEVYAQGIPLSELVAQTVGPEGKKNVEIRVGEKAYFDRSVDVGQLTINGELSCQATGELKADTISVNGKFNCGTASAPFKGKFYISLKHNPNLDPKSTSSYRGLVVNANGSLALFGDSARAGHLKLIKTVEKDEQVLKLSSSVEGKWQAGDEIVIAPTSYNPAEAEKHAIKAISGDTVTLFGKIKFRHWGATQTLQTQRGPVILDQRAEIANLTRHIVIRGDETGGAISEADVPYGQWGAHVMVNRNGYAQVDSVEFTKVGQAGVMARYPFHWHFAGPVPGQFIKNSAIHHSYQRCITIHQTMQSRVENNVCYNFRGHGFFLEDGNEIDNVITKNVGILAIRPLASRVLLSSDNTDSAKSGVTGKRFPATAVFWISNPQNTVTDNIAAGSLGTGFWNSFVPVIRRFNSVTGEYDGAELARPQTTNTTAFDRNVAHSTQVGHTWDGAPVEAAHPDNATNPWDMNNSNNPQDRKLSTSHYAPAQTPTFKGLVAWKNIQVGIYFRGNTVIYDDLVMADNGWSMFLAYNQIMRNATFVGVSQNNGPAEEAYLYTSKRYRELQAGVVLYDGPWELNNADFIDFPSQKWEREFVVGEKTDVTPTPFFTIGGSDKFTNISRKLRFSPEPYYRLYMYPLEGTNGWLEEILSNNIKDLDGTLTGLIGGSLLPEAKFTRHGSCTTRNFGGNPKSFHGFVLCPADTEHVTIVLSGDNAFNGARVPYLMRRNDGPVSFPKTDWGWLDALGDSTRSLLMRKKILFTNPAHTYEILLKPSVHGSMSYVRVAMNAPKLNAALPLTKVSGLGSNCVLEGSAHFGTPEPKRYANLDELRRSTDQGAFYSSGNDFYVKLNAVRRLPLLRDGAENQESESGNFLMRCSEPVKNAVIGYVDRVITKGSEVFVEGWACDYNKNQSIDVHVYAGGAAGQGGSMVAFAKAELNSEEAVNFACANPNMIGHRFSAKVGANHLIASAGQPVFVHGISSSGGSHLPINRSGALTLPGAKLNAGDVRGHFDGLSSTGLLSGWACQQNVPTSIEVEVFAGDPTLGGTLVTRNLANSNSEAAVGSACGTQGVAHRFNIQLTEAQRVAHQGKSLFVRALPIALGKERKVLTSTGVLTLTKFAVKGTIDRVVTSGADVYVEGWACDWGREKQISIHIFAGGHSGVGQMIGSTMANATSEAAVATACADVSKLGHRYRWKVPAAVLSAHKGKKIHIHGISLSNNNNLVIGRSGEHAIP